MREQERIRRTIMRCGTSKGIFLRRNDLPKDPVLRDRLILAIFGSPDIRQIDGLGGADLLTSKLAIIGPPTHPDADVDYTFGQVGITEAKVDYFGNCGNVSSGIGPYAIYQGLVEPVEPFTTVRIHLTNSKRILVAQVPVKDGEPLVEGDYQIDGCPGTGAKISLDFSGTAGAFTNRILPTGNVKDTLKVEGLGDVVVSIVDAANTAVFVHAESLGIKGTENPFEIDGNPVLLENLEKIRGVAAQKIGFVKDWRDARRLSQLIPFIVMVNSPRAYVNFTTGKSISADSYDVLARLLFNQRMHKAYPLTGTVCTGVAAKIPGTVVNELVSKSAVTAGEFRIGHPAGIIAIEVDVKMEDGKPILKKAALGRTVRIMMEGFVFVRKSIMSGK
jgi:methylitaconate Delta-isomerase